MIFHMFFHIEALIMSANESSMNDKGLLKTFIMEEEEAPFRILLVRLVSIQPASRSLMFKSFKIVNKNSNKALLL